jgi:predicted nucleotidyltransferase
MKKVAVILKNRFTELNEELFLLENKTIVNQETFEEICEQNYFIDSDAMACFYKSWFGNK